MNDSLIASAALPGATLDSVSQTLANRPSPLGRGAPAGDAHEAAQSFEAFFISQMLAEMFAGVETDPVFGGGPGETIFRSLMIDEYGKAVAASGGIGIADSVMREIVRLQEVDTNEL